MDSGDAFVGFVMIGWLDGDIGVVTVVVVLGVEVR